MTNRREILTGALSLMVAARVNAKEKVFRPSNVPAAITVEDIVRATFILPASGQDSMDALAPSNNDVSIESSQSGDQIFFLLSSNIERDANRVDVLLVTRESIDAFITGQRKAHSELIGSVWCNSERIPFSGARWSDSGKTVLMLADTDAGRQLFEVSPSNRTINAITSVRGGVLGAARANCVTVYSHLTERTPHPYKPMWVGDRDVTALAFEDQELGMTDRHFVVQQPDGAPQTLHSEPAPRAWFNHGIWISPDGNWAVSAEDHFNFAVPASWDGYRVGRRPADQLIGGAVRGTVNEYMIADLKRGSFRSLLRAPIAGNFQGARENLNALFSSDSRFLFVYGTYAGSFDPPERANASPGLYAIDLITDRSALLCRLDAESDLPRLSARIEGRNLLLIDGPTQAVRRAFDVYTWEAAGHRGYTPRARLVVTQAIDAPPAISVNRGAWTKTFFDPNPKLRSSASFATREIKWTAADGNIWKGILVTPRSISKRIPLVIQTHGYRQGEFLLTGGSGQSPGLAFVSRGFALLQMQEQSVGLFTHEEGAIFQAAVEGAISATEIEGTDRDRVALQGFSHTGFDVLYFITHSKSVHAAVIGCNMDATYGQYIQSFTFGGGFYTRLLETYNGGRPFGNGLDKWKSEAPGFMADRVVAPLLSWTNQAGVFANWEMYAALRINKKPADYLYLPESGHGVFRPTDRLTVYHATIDWVDYWLNGTVDPDDNKRELFERWDLMRQQVEATS